MPCIEHLPGMPLVSFWFSSIIDGIASLLATSKDFDTHTGM